MNRVLAAALVAATVAVHGPAFGLPDGLEVRTYEGGLDFPVDMAWVPGTKKIFFTEKNTGKIRVMVGRRLLGRPCVDLDVASAGERGALGIALHPRFKRNHKLYVYYTNADPLQHRVTRFIVRRNRCRNPRHIVRGIDASSSGYHNGGQIVFFRRKLFVATGDAHDPATAQSTDNRLGKVLRYNKDGTVPADNPFSQPGDPSPVWSYGHRNPFGLAARSGKRLYATENGPDCDDELNLIKRARNYGWGPGYQCGTAGVGIAPKGPMRRWDPPIVPTDPWWYRGRIKRFSGALFMGDFSTGRLHRFDLRDRGRKVRRHRVVFDGGGGIVDVSKGPGGWLYFLTPSSIRRVVKT